jgi:hypothetical protein
MSKRDDINRLYEASSIITNITNSLFWLNIGISIISLFSSNIAKDILNIIQICFSGLFMVLSIVNDCYSWYEAEKARRKNNIQIAFDIKFQELTTIGYYNNHISPSLLKYAVNTFESNYFSKIIAQKTMPKEFTKTILSLLVLLISIRYIANGDLLLIISQIVFSSYFILDAIMLLVYTIKISHWYDNAYENFITVGIKDKYQLIWLMYYIVEYECIKSYFKIKLDSKIFKKLNPSLSKEWDKIQKSIFIQEDMHNIVV